MAESESGRKKVTLDPFANPSAWKQGTKPSQKRSARRDPPSATISTDSWYLFNTELTLLMDEAGRSRGIEESSYRVGYVVSAELGFVGFFPTTQSDESTALIRRYSRKATSQIRFHHEGPFDDAPTLRPATKVQAEGKLVSHPFDGLPMVALMVAGAKEVRTEFRETTKERMAAEEEAKAAKAAAKKKKSKSGNAG